MSEAIEKLRAANTERLTLSSGRIVLVRRPRPLEYMAVMKSLPLPILEKVQASGDLPEEEQNAAGRQLMEEADLEQTLAMARSLDHLVNITVRAVVIDDVVMELTPEDQVADELEQDECLEIMKYAQGRLGSPKAPASPTSVSSSNGLEPISTELPVNDTAWTPQYS